MKDNVTPIEMLFDKAEVYSKTTVELLKLKAIRKSADVISSLITKAIITIIVGLFLFLANIALALWLGKLTGEYFYGFLIVASFYLFIGLLSYIFRKKLIQIPFKDNIISKMMDDI